MAARRDRLKRLALPFLAYSLLYAALLGAPDGFDLDHVATGHLGGYAWAGQYYFVVMFQLVPLLTIAPVLGAIAERPFV